MTDDLIAQLTVKAPRRLLEELAKLAKGLAASDRPRPEVEVYLAGAVIRGRVVAIGDDGATPVVLIQTGGSPRAPAIAYVRIDQIIAVIATDASVLVKPAIADQPAPSKLELSRALGARADSLTTALGRALPLTASPDLDDDGRRAVAAVLPALIDTLRAIARDPGGKDALDALAGIELGAGARAEVHRDGGTLVVITSRDAMPPERLRGEIEKLL